MEKQANSSKHTDDSGLGKDDTIARSLSPILQPKSPEKPKPAKAVNSSPIKSTPVKKETAKKEPQKKKDSNKMTPVKKVEESKQPQKQQTFMALPTPQQPQNTEPLLPV